jgi:hypothetical protein
VANLADTRTKLDGCVDHAKRVWETSNCPMRRLDYQQEDGLASSMPLGVNRINVKRQITTSNTAIFIPFTTQELFQGGKDLVYYGINALSNNMIMADRKRLKNPNGLYNQGRICNREKFFTFSKKDFRKPYPKFLYYEGINSAS